MDNTIPNLDAMTEEEDLHKFWDKHRHGHKSVARVLLGDERKGYIRISKDLANYASNKAAAMLSRRRGDLVSASIYETICDNIYDKLPTDLKW